MIFECVGRQYYGPDPTPTEINRKVSFIPETIGSGPLRVWKSDLESFYTNHGKCGIY